MSGWSQPVGVDRAPEGTGAAGDGAKLPSTRVTGRQQRHLPGGRGAAVCTPQQSGSGGEAGEGSGVSPTPYPPPAGPGCVTPPLLGGAGSLGGSEHPPPAEAGACWGANDEQQATRKRTPESHAGGARHSGAARWETGPPSTSTERARGVEASAVSTTVSLSHRLAVQGKQTVCAFLEMRRRPRR